MPAPNSQHKRRNSQHSVPSSQHNGWKSQHNEWAAMVAESPRNKQKQLGSSFGFRLNFGAALINKRSNHPALPSCLRVNLLP